MTVRKVYNSKRKNKHGFSICCHGKTADYAGPIGTPEQVLELAKNPNCVLCGQPLNELLNRRSVMHHNHDSGELIGYTHPACNTVEGIVKRMTVEARRILLLRIS